MNADKIKKVVTNEHGDLQLTINLRERNLTVNDCLVESITLFACDETAGDLAVNWQAHDDSDYEHNTQLLMRDNNDNNSNTQTMGAFYWDRAFTEELRAILQEHGFSADASADVFGSEWGMQDVGRASYDAYLIGKEMLNAYGLEYID